MNQGRREFLKTSIQGVAACCLMTGCTHLSGAGWDKKPEYDPESYPDEVSKEMTYCAYRCSRECPWLTATLKGDKKTLNELTMQWSKQHGDKRMPDDKKFCYGCKPIGKPLGYIVAVCAVRKCAIEKGFSTCMECENLEKCDKELWTLYPTHRDYVLKQKKAAATSIKE
jgi:hypothetical protein